MLTFQKNISLKPYHTFMMDIVADCLTIVSSLDDIRELRESPEYTNHRHNIIIGGGSNLLFTDNFHGLVIINQLHGKDIIQQDEKECTIKVASGEHRHAFVMRSIDNGRAGIENLALIPGTVGASPIQNIGAYGVEAGDCIVSVEWIDMLTGEMKTYTHDECHFSYRNSIFKSQLKQDFFITAVTFRLQKQWKDYTPNLSYRGIADQLEKMWQTQWHGWWHTQSIKTIAEAVITLRQSKLPDWTQLGTAGSFFANPIISETEYQKLQTSFPDLVGHTTTNSSSLRGTKQSTPPKGIKLSAWQLIELCWLKGYRDGDAGIYDRHALVLVNHGNASWPQMAQLITHIQQSVQEKFGIMLMPEVNIIKKS